ncbi:MAG: EamA family transporter [Chloroflexi bacterium]|nr:EamA family transporter [Chloroflexota bacterium]
MTALALGLVLLAGVLHATWNLLVKQGTNQEIFVWLSQVALSVLLIPVGVVLIWNYPVEPLGWWFLLATSILHVLYFLFLGRGYASGDLSMVYPIARGMGPALVPILAVLVLGESVSLMAVAGIVSVVAGIYTVYWWGRFAQIIKDPLSLLRQPGTRYALLTGLVIASYSVLDKVGIRYVTPFLYMYLMSMGISLGLAPYILRAHAMDAVRNEWRINRGRIVVVGLLVFLTYGMVLTALQFSRVSYIAPAREVGIVVGVIFGITILKEPFGRGRLIGSSLIVAGLALIALAP